MKMLIKFLICEKRFSDLLRLIFTDNISSSVVRKTTQSSQIFITQKLFMREKTEVSLASDFEPINSYVYDIISLIYSPRILVVV